MPDNDDNLSQLSKALPWLPRWLFALLSIIKPYIKRIIRLLRRALRRHAKRSAPKAVKGLYPYYEKDGELFARLGRAAEIQRCMDLLEDLNNRLIVVYGPSGSGKTSLLRAGINYNLLKANPARDVPVCVYWPAIEQDASSALASTLALHRKTPYQEDLANVISSTKDRLVLLIDQCERLRRDDPSHKPIFDLLKSVCRHPAPHAIQVVVAFDLTYLSDWLSFQEEAGIHALRVPVAPLAMAPAIDVMRTIMSAANISIGDNIEKNYIQDVADADGVSPVAIALGALVFATWGDIEGRIKLRDYTRAGEIRAILAAHVRERLGWAYVLEEDRGPLVRALVSEMIDLDKNQRKLSGASVGRIAEVAGLAPDRIKTYLQDLEDGRILEAIPSTDRYTIAHDQLVPVLRELDRGSAPSGQAVLDRYLQWKRRQKGYYLRGEDLDWARRHVSEFVTGADSISRAIYLRKSRWAAIWRAYLGLFVVIALIGGGLAAHHYVRLSLFHKQFRNAKLPIEIYDEQGQFESLLIATGDLSDLDWLKSDRLNELSVTGSNLRSLKGVKSVHNLRSLDVLLDTSGSLRGIADLHELRSLTLHNLGHLQSAPVLDIAALEQLRRADFDFQGAQFSVLPDLSPHLEELTLDIRNSKISDLSAILKVPELTKLELFLDHSQVQSLAVLAGLDHLKRLYLSLDENQLRLLSDLEKSHASFTLGLDLQPSLKAVPDLRRIPGLRNVSVRISGANAAQVNDVVQPSEVEDLSVVIDGSGIQEFPPVGQLRHLNRLELGFESTAVRQLPDLSQLQQLERLSLNLNSTVITNLPEFSHLQYLKELNLFLRESRSVSLHGIDQLPKLQSLILDIRGAHINELDALSGVHSLEQLTLFLRWSQVHDLPDLSELIKLHTLELIIDGDWGLEELPDISHLQSLTKLTLTLIGSHIEKLPSLSQLSRLETITVRLGENSEMDLSMLEDTKTLQEVRLDCHRSAMQTLPDLRNLPTLRKAAVDISGSKIRDLNQLATIPKLEELTVDSGFKSLKGVPATVRQLRVIH